MSLSLPLLPKTEMFIGGTMSMEWQEFFRLLFERVGGYEPESGSGGDLEPRVAELESKVAALESIEPFEYYLPQNVWCQENFPPGKVETAGVSGLSPPIKVSYVGGILLNFYSSVVTTVGFTFIPPKGRKVGADLIPRLQWDIESNGLVGEAQNVKWDFRHSWVNVGGSAPTPVLDSVTVDVQSFPSGLIRELSFPTIAGSGFDNESLLICSLTRDVGVANNYSGGAYYANFGIGFEVDTVGGMTLTSK